MSLEGHFLLASLSAMLAFTLFYMCQPIQARMEWARFPITITISY
jgi:hypothetical protein